MPKIIVKVPYIKARTAIANLIDYVASREGVDNSINRVATIKKPTKKQKEYIDEVLRLCPDAKESYEYTDYIENPTLQNASAFITVAAEYNPMLYRDKETYINYIATRPNVEKTGEHGLFGSEDSIILNHVKDEIREHQAGVWTPIISLRREDAARLGYDNAEAWRELIRSKQLELADIFRIPQDDFRWYAAYHNEGHHPHIHMFIYAKDSSKGYLSQQGIERMKSIFTNDIFKNDMYELYNEKTMHRKRISDKSKAKLKELAEKVKDKDYTDSPICDMLIDLSRKLKTVKGKKVYGYLPKPIRRDVDNIVKAMAEDDDIAELYNQWCMIQKKIVGTYTDKEIEQPKLWENKEFKKIRNAVVQETVRLEYDDNINIEQKNTDTAFESTDEPMDSDTDEETVKDDEEQPASQGQPVNTDVAMSTFNLFCRLANIIDNDGEKKIDGHNKTIVDSKERRELMKKKQRLGIKMG